MLVRDAELEGHVLDVRVEDVEDATVTEIGASLRRTPGEAVLDAAGGALLPGLHDHHCHLQATVAASWSVRVGPPDVTDYAGVIDALRTAGTGRDGWVRAVGYHAALGALGARESLRPSGRERGDGVNAPPEGAALLDRWALDRIHPDRPVRVQHRSGALWILNSAGLRAVGLEDGGPAGPGGHQRSSDDAPGAERDAHGLLTGRLWRSDAWLADRLRRPAATSPLGDERRRALADLGAAGASRGVVGFTDCTPDRQDGAITDLAAAHAEGAVPQRLHLMVRPDQPADTAARLGLPSRITLGPVKVLLDDHRLPDLGALAAFMRGQHATGHATAIHCVTAAQLVLAVAAYEDAGVAAGDRIEHAAVVPASLVARLARLGVTVVTQPSFVAERGDDYRRDVPLPELDELWPARTLLRAGIPLAAGTDTPFGSDDPWAAIRAAMTRTTPSGAVLGAAERVDASTALGWFLADAERPWRRRRIRVGTRADLCLLRLPLTPALAAPDATNVRFCLVGGRRV